MNDKEFRQLDLILSGDNRINSRGTIIGNDQYKPDIGIVDSSGDVICCIESSSSGDRKATLAEMLQAEKYAVDNNLFLDLIICLSGKSKTSPTPKTQKLYLEPYFSFLKQNRKDEKIGIKKLYLIGELSFINYILDNRSILEDDFVKECTILE